MQKPNKTKCSITGLVIAGLVSAIVGLSLIIQPVPYVSIGGNVQYVRIPALTFFSGNDSAFCGFLILFMGCFILMVAYKNKKT